jgi:hypothetical protein
MKRLSILCSLILALAFAGHAEITADQISAVVRILSIGDTSVSTGTGFVVTNDGLILTNNHVIASKPEVADHPYNYLVLQKIGDRVMACPATFVAQMPNADVAAIRAPGVKAAPLTLLTTPPALFQEVYSVGFPALADELAFGKIAPMIQKKVKQAGGKSVDITDLFGTERLGEVAASKLIEEFVTPTSPSGHVEKITDRSVVDGGTPIPIIQHSCTIRGGNSGGPLLNGGGQILGIVGDSAVDNSEEHKGQEIIMAIRTIQVQKFLQSNNIAAGCNITDKAWTAPAPAAVHIPVPVPVKFNFIPIIIATSLAVAVALAALLITLIKARRKTGMTALLDSLRNKGVTSGTQLLEMIGARPKSGGSPARSSVLTTPKGASWKLDGRTTTGKTFQIPISESMFATNSSRLVVGRSRDLCDLVVEDETVSRQHAEIRKNGSGFVVADRNSSNGTAVNGVFNRKPFEAVPFKPGDTLTIGDVKLDFR